MKKTLLTISILLFNYFLFCQNIAIYDFENLSLGDINNQDAWKFSTSLSSLNNGYNCPIIGSPLVPQIANMPNEGNYQASKTIQSGSGWGSQFLILSRVNDSNWSFPSFQDKQYLIITFEMTGGCWGKSFRLAYDQNNDGDFGQNCGQADPNEASFGINWFACGTPTKLKLFDASSQIIAQQDNYAVGGWIRYMLVIDFYANNNQGSIGVFTKHLTNSESWQAVPSMQNINASFDINSNGANNPYNLNGIMLEHQAGGNSIFDNFKFTAMNFNHNDTTICEGTAITIGSTINGSQYLWNTGDTTATIDVNTEGVYFVDFYIDGLKVLTDSIIVSEKSNPQLSINDTSYCQENSITIYAPDSMHTYLWNDGSNADSLIVNKAGVYSLNVSLNGCSSSDTILVSERNNPQLSINDTSYCQENFITIYAPDSMHTYLWNNGSNADSLIVNQQGAYHLTVSKNGCYSSDTINIDVIPGLQSLGKDTFVCDNSYVSILLDTIYDFVYWNDGDTNYSKNIFYRGNYSCFVKNKGCIFYSDTLVVNEKLMPKILETTKDTLICDNFPLLLKVKAKNYDKINWFDSHTDTVNKIKHQGLYWVQVINECGLDIDTIIVQTENCNCREFIPTIFTPNNDNLNDFFGFSSDCIPSKYFRLQIFNRWGQLVFNSKDYKKSWNGRFKGQKCSDGVYSYIIQVKYQYGKSKRIVGKFTLKN